MIKRQSVKGRAARVVSRLDARLPDQSPLSEKRPGSAPPHRAPLVAAYYTGTYVNEFGAARHNGEWVEANRTHKKFWYTKSCQGFMSRYASTTSQRVAARWVAAVKRKARVARFLEKNK